MCAIAGAFNVPNAAYVVSLMLKAMQHRGQEAAGITSTDKEGFHELRDKGLVDEVFGAVDVHERLPGTAAIGHVRYSTAGDDGSAVNIQPLCARVRGTPTAIVHNGNLTNYRERRAKMEEKGAIFQSRSDTELFLHQLARTDGESVDERLAASLLKAEGAWSILVLTPDAMYAAVDPLGFRPLVCARYGDGWLFASETCAFDLLGVQPTLSPERGAVLKTAAEGLAEVASVPKPAIARHCSFEHIYFSRPDSYAFDVSSDEIRERLGKMLALAMPTEVDLVTSIPDSSNAIAVSYAEAIATPFRHALIRNHYTGRTFITPKQHARELGVRMKLNAVRRLVEGKRVAVVDDSLVRGTTARKVADLLRSAGAKEVHMRIGSPPVVHPCYWGIDTPNRRELAAATSTHEQLTTMLGVDSLAYLSVDDLNRALRDQRHEKYCTTCFTGDPPEQQLISAQSLVRRT